MNALKRIGAALKAAYRKIADHATKLLGLLGLLLTSLDPAMISAAVNQYLGTSLSPDLSRHIGQGLFTLVIVRGAYTGWKSKQP